MRWTALLVSLLCVSPLAAREVVEISVAAGEVDGMVMFCALSTRPDDTTGYALLAISNGGSVDQPTIVRAAGMSPGEEAATFTEINQGTVRHICASGGASVLAVVVDAEGRSAVESVMPSKKLLRRDTPYSASHQAMKMADEVLDVLGLKKGYSYARAGQGAERSIHFYRDLLLLNRPTEQNQEPAP